MRKHFLLFAVLLFIPSLLKTQILFTENFDYPAGDSIGAHGWNWNTGVTNTIFVTSPGLVFANYISSGVGNACHLRNNGNDAYKSFTADSLGSIYLSFMVNVDSIRTAGDYFIALISPTSTTNYTARFYAKDSLGGLAFGLSKSTAGSGGIFYTAGNYTRGVTYLVVIKYQFNPGQNDDAMNAYIFSAGIPLTEPGSPAIGPVTGTANDAAIGRVALRQGSAVNAPTLNVDGLNVYKNWANILSTSISQNATIAESFSLSQNYPNPFNPQTKIDFSIPQRGYVTLNIFNSLGETVETLVSSNLNAGTYTVDFNGKDLNSGVYFYTFNFTNNNSRKHIQTKKLLLIK